jgi:glycosyltransferase involved in cell wall biosynthesis
MACGTPVISSNISSLAEVMGDAGILLDPTDRHGWREAICRLWDDEPLRLACRERGLLRARDFPVTALANRIIAVYKDVAAS